MVEPEFAAVVVEPPLPQKLPRPRVMQRRIVDHDQPGKAREIRPHEIVTARVPELVDDEIVRRALVSPDEVVRTRLVVAIDRELAFEARQQLGVGVGNAGIEPAAAAKTMQSWSLVVGH